MRVNTQEFLRRRPWVAIASSVAFHLLVVGALIWARPPVGQTEMKRGEPLFVELPKADELAARGLPGAPAAEPAKPLPPAKPTPPPARPLPAPKAPPVVAKAPAPAPRQERAVEPAPPPSAPAPVRSADPPSEEPAVAKAPEPEPRPAPREPAGPPRIASVPPGREAAPDIRSSLGRSGPGTGGAGGRGEGRAGIEGEPIPLDSKDPKYNDYLDRIRRMIKAKWAYPCVRESGTGPCEYKSADLVIEFGILKDGRVPFVEVRTRSAFDIYDEYAVNAIKLASPFPPVPPALMAAARPGSTGVSVAAHFVYIVESSLTNLLR